MCSSVATSQTHQQQHNRWWKCLRAWTKEHTWVTGWAVVSDEAGQAGHSLRGEVPDCVKHICGVDPVVIWVKTDKCV